MTTRIIDLGQVRDALAQWDLVRRHLANRKVKGFHITLMDEDGAEHVFSMGLYDEDPQAAMRALLRSSAARALAHDEPPLFQASQF